MATQRYVSTSFWQDPWVLDELSSDERYTYLYLLTAPGSNIAGVYELSIKTAEMHTGFDRDQLIKIFRRFEEAGKAFYYGRYVIIPTWPRHQRYDERQSIKDGIIKVLKNLPESVWKKVCSVDYQFPLSQVDRPLATLDTPPTPQEGEESPPRAPQGPPYLDPESEPKTDTNTDSRGAASPEPDGSSHLPAVTHGKPTISGAKEPSPLKDDLANLYQQTFLAVQPVATWGNVGQERGTLSTLAKKTRELFPATPFADEHELAKAILTAFYNARDSETHEFWTGAPYTPSGLLSRWDKVTTRLAREWERERMWEEFAR